MPLVYPGVGAAAVAVLCGRVDNVGVAVEELAVAVARDWDELEFLEGPSCQEGFK